MTFQTRLRVPEQVLVSDVDGESVILNLRTEALFSLDAVGTRMLTAVTTADSVQAAYDRLIEEYDVEPELLRDDLVDMLDSLFEHGLLEVHPS